MPPHESLFVSGQDTGRMSVQRSKPPHLALQTVDIPRCSAYTSVMLTHHGRGSGVLPFSVTSCTDRSLRIHKTPSDLWISSTSRTNACFAHEEVTRQTIDTKFR